VEKEREYGKVAGERGGEGYWVRGGRVGTILDMCSNAPLPSPGTGVEIDVFCTRLGEWNIKAWKLTLIP